MLYEGGTRSPLIVWGPGLVAKSKAGTQNETSIFAAFDLVPSLLDIAGVAAPEGVRFDGENLAPVLLGKSTDSRAAPIFWRRPPDRKTASPALPERLPDLAVREGDWKLVWRTPLPSALELYNIPEDPSEKTNLADKNPQKVAELQKRIEELARESAKSLFLVDAFKAVTSSAHGAPALPTEDGYFTQGD